MSRYQRVKNHSSVNCFIISSAARRVWESVVFLFVSLTCIHDLNMRLGVMYSGENDVRGVTLSLYHTRNAEDVFRFIKKLLPPRHCRAYFSASPVQM